MNILLRGILGSQRDDLRRNLMKLRKEELQNLCLSSNTSMRSAEHEFPLGKYEIQDKRAK